MCAPLGRARRQQEQGISRPAAAGAKPQRRQEHPSSFSWRCTSRALHAGWKARVGAAPRPPRRRATAPQAGGGSREPAYADLAPLRSFLAAAFLETLRSLPSMASAFTAVSFSASVISMWQGEDM